MQPPSGVEPSPVLGLAISINGVPVRLTAERWTHILERRIDFAANQEQVLQAVREPDEVLAGSGGALRSVRQTSPGRRLVAVYRELSAEDGFIITAWETSRPIRGTVLWQKQR